MSAKELILDIFLFILENGKKQISYNEIFEHFNSSEKTIDRNLKLLEEKKFIILERKSHKSKPLVKVNWDKFNLLK